MGGQYAKRPYMTCSFQVKHVNTHTWFIRKRLRCVFATQKIDITESRVVVQYVKCHI